MISFKSVAKVRTSTSFSDNETSTSTPPPATPHTTMLNGRCPTELALGEAGASRVDDREYG
jgi:hypothetical protein